jgi:hypothetical protein
LRNAGRRSPRSAAASASGGSLCSARRRAARISIRSDLTLISWWRSSATTAPRSANFSRCVTAVGRPVDLVEEGSVRNPFIRAGIERSAETLYGS